MHKAIVFPSLLSIAVMGAALVVQLEPSTATAAGGTGTIEGTVSFSGPAPARKAIDKSSDAFCKKHKSKDDSIVVTGGKLADVHVGIKSGKAGSHKAPSTPVVINQRGCVYEPRVAGIISGQELVVKNGDKTMHNVHAYDGRRTLFNRGQPPAAGAIKSKAPKPGSVMTLKCDVHSWMRSDVVVTDHPFFDVTEKNGKFTIKNVPAGKYTFEAWHPTLGKKRKRVTVSPGKTATADFSFSK